MCATTVCRNCSKVTTVGCGGHIEQAMWGIPIEQICVCPGSLTEAYLRERRIHG